MSVYQTILLDVDDTLLDFKEGQDRALVKLFQHEEVELTPALYHAYIAKNHALWTAYERQEIPRDQVLAERFTYIFNKAGLRKDGSAMDVIFRDYLAEEAILIDGAMETVASLAQNHGLYIVTNGVSVTQYRRLEKSGLQPYLKDVFVSEDTGFQKPMKEYFDYVFARIPQVDLSKTLIVGDSLLADIAGGNQAGITTCWYNPAKKVNDSPIQPTFEIAHLSELHTFLN